MLKTRTAELLKSKHRGRFLRISMAESQEIAVALLLGPWY